MTFVTSYFTCMKYTLYPIEYVSCTGNNKIRSPHGQYAQKEQLLQTITQFDDHGNVSTKKYGKM